MGGARAAALAEACIAAVIAWTPSDIPAALRLRAALVAVATTPIVAGIGAAAVRLVGPLPAERTARTRGVLSPK